MNRRNFLKSMVSLAVVAALPKVILVDEIFNAPLPLKLWGDGIHDDTAAIQAMIDAAGRNGTVTLPKGVFKVTGSLTGAK